MSMIFLWLYALIMRMASGTLRARLRDRADIGKEDMSRLAERRGRDLSIRLPGPMIWLHAASVGGKKK